MKRARILTRSICPPDIPPSTTTASFDTHSSLRPCSTAAVMSARAKAYRLFIIERAWYAHLYGLMLCSVACTVAIARNPGQMTLPFLPQPGANAWWLEPRWYFVSACPCMFACAVFAPVWYIDRYERFCDLITVLGMLTRHAAMFDGTDVRQDVVSLMYFLRPLFLLTSVLSLRYELAKQWKMYVVRVGLDVSMNLSRARRFGVSDVAKSVAASAAAGSLPRAVASELARNAPLLLLTVGAHWAVERRDRTAFEERVRLMRQMSDGTDVGALERRESRVRRGVGPGRPGRFE